MEFLALELLPWSLLCCSLALALTLHWRTSPALGMLAAVNVARCAVYLAGWYFLNPWGSCVSALLILGAAYESMRLAGLRPWPSLFCAGWGLSCASLALRDTESADPLKTATHVAALIMLAVAIFVSLVRRAGWVRIAREGLLILYVIGAGVSSKQRRPDEWWSILTTETVQLLALGGLIWIAAQERDGVPQQRGF